MDRFVCFTLKSGEMLYARVSSVKAVQAKSPTVSNIVVDGHDYDVNATVHEVLDLCQFDVRCVGHEEV